MAVRRCVMIKIVNDKWERGLFKNKGQINGLSYQES